MRLLFKLSRILIGVYVLNKVLDIVVDIKHDEKYGRNEHDGMDDWDGY